jgi:hypothetical protein
MVAPPVGEVAETKVEHARMRVRAPDGPSGGVAAGDEARDMLAPFPPFRAWRGGLDWEAVVGRFGTNRP